MSRKKKEHTTNTIISFSPHLECDDSMAAYWIRQVTIRLRREVCWLRSLSPEGVSFHEQDRVSEALGMHRFFEQKKAFFSRDPTARYLSDQLKEQPVKDLEIKRGSFSWLVKELLLDKESIFVLALALAPVLDHAMGPVIAFCRHNPHNHYPTLSLAQQLLPGHLINNNRHLNKNYNRTSTNVEQSSKLFTLLDPSHPLISRGIIITGSQHTSSYVPLEWESPLVIPARIAQSLLFPDSPPAEDLMLIQPVPVRENDIKFRQLLGELHGREDQFTIVRLKGKNGTDFLESAANLCAQTNKHIAAVNATDPAGLGQLMTYAWLKGYDLFCDEEITDLLFFREKLNPSLFLHLKKLPVTLIICLPDDKKDPGIPESVKTAPLTIPPLSYFERKDIWFHLLKPETEELTSAIVECARRFRFEKKQIMRAVQRLAGTGKKIKGSDLVESCRAGLDLDMGDLAQHLNKNNNRHLKKQQLGFNFVEQGSTNVEQHLNKNYNRGSTNVEQGIVPRFCNEHLILPYKQQLQFEEIKKAMQSLTYVHYEMGTARAMNECGISVLFAGPPGTGKTMAAEILAYELDLPLYRIDLSQVVNKYIGETEKNLKKVFDAADISDVILFFDEADSLFGKRTEVKDAHDRYANLEISYLLDRMERFKGLAILATNRKKDLDDAFLRRLRYILDFPCPKYRQRKQIWNQVIPEHVDASRLDIDYLAKRFQLTGGHIRSIVFNACLQSGGDSDTRTNGSKGCLTMEDVLVCVKREYEKMNQVISLETFHPYEHVIQKLENE